MEWMEEPRRGVTRCVKLISNFRQGAHLSPLPVRRLLLLYSRSVGEQNESAFGGFIGFGLRLKFSKPNRVSNW